MFANFTSNLAIFEVCDRLYKNFFAAFLSRILTSSIFTPEIKNLDVKHRDTLYLPRDIGERVTN